MPEATLDAYREVQARLGLRRTGIVQPNAYGTDNTTTLKAVAALGTGACGVAIVTPATPENELACLYRGGMRGARPHARYAAAVMGRRRGRSVPRRAAWVAGAGVLVQGCWLVA